MEGEVVFSARRFCQLRFGFDYRVLRGMGNYKGVLQLYKLPLEEGEKENDRRLQVAGQESEAMRQEEEVDTEHRHRERREVSTDERRRLRQQRQRRRQQEGEQQGRQGQRRRNGSRRRGGQRQTGNRKSQSVKRRAQSRVSIYQVLPKISSQHSTLRLLDSR